MNTYILLHMDNSIIVNHINDIFINCEGNSSIKNTFKMAQLKSMGNGTRKGLAAA